jgi:3',5'-cyclic AMP phosphodiesterase CpdA
MTVRLVQISDTHLSPSTDAFVPNARRLWEALHESPPDLIVNTGDISLDGADSLEDLAFAAGLHRDLPAEALLLPGNHDVGDYAVLGGRQPVTAERLARWRETVGADRFVRDIPGWRLIGLNSQILDSGLDAEAEQWEAIAEALDGAAGRSVALFLHKPLCEQRLDDDAVNYWPVLHAARRRLRAMFAHTAPALIASGHIHQWRDRVADGLRQVWAPPVSFIVGEESQPSVGSKLLGAVEHLLHPDGGFTTRLLTVDGLALHDIARMRHIYGRPAAAEA